MIVCPFSERFETETDVCAVKNACKLDIDQNQTNTRGSCDATGKFPDFKTHCSGGRSSANICRVENFTQKEIFTESLA